MGLLGQKNQYARSLSSGERQKLSFLRAVIFKPRFIMMDETLSNLDPESEEIIIGLMKDIQQDSPVTWLISARMRWAEFLLVRIKVKNNSPPSISTLRPCR